MNEIARSHTAVGQTNADRDALHILPLSIVPIETPALGRARLIKNVRLQSVVEVFVEEATGSGQIEVEALRHEFGWPPGEPHPDLALLRKLALLPSYDVYSLRILFREHGIDINDVDDLRLSESKSRELTHYMREFTHPLILRIYGGGDVEIRDFDDIVRLFKDPDVVKIRAKLSILAQKLGIDMGEVPRFLEDYGDTFLSLSYFRHCMDKIEPIIDEFMHSVAELRTNYQLKTDRNLMQTATVVESTINELMAAISGRFETFDKHTEGMWENLTAERFRQVKRFIESYHTIIGGCLCALTVKMSAWSRLFPDPETGGPTRRAEFILSEMKQGIDRLREIQARASGTELRLGVVGE